MQAELFFSFFSVFKVLLLNISKTYSDSVSSKWPKNSIYFGYAFLGVLGQFDRNRKGLTRIQPQVSLIIHYTGDS